jgi:hypothetical protein
VRRVRVDGVLRRWLRFRRAWDMASDGDRVGKGVVGWKVMVSDTAGWLELSGRTVRAR